MKYETIVHAFLEKEQIYFGDMHIVKEVLQNEWCFIPIIIMLVDDYSKRSGLSTKLLSYELRQKNDAMFGYELHICSIYDHRKFLSIIKEMGGISYLDSVLERHSRNGYDTKKFSEKVKSELLRVYKNEAVIRSSSNIELSFFESLYRKSMSESRGDKMFSYTGNYSRIDQSGKQFFDELTYLTVAERMSTLSTDQFDVLDGDLDFDPKVVLAAILGHSDSMQRLANYFGVPQYSIRFEQSIYHLRELLANKATVLSREDSPGWYAEAKRKTSKLTSDEFIKRSFAGACEDGFFDVVVWLESMSELSHADVNHFLSSNRKTNQLISGARHINQIEESLTKTVKGQHKAINEISKGLMSSLIDVPKGPRNIFTFMGPSGVGKTMLAEELSVSLCQVAEAGYEYNTFNMESYTNRKDAMRLFGVGIQYTSPSMGVLTSCVKAQPRQVLIFDEIEKAHPVVLQSLLSVLSDGKAKDNTTQETVDFSQCVCVFTTNLGADLITKNMRVEDVCPFELLREDSGDNVSQMSPEFVNRLMKGNAVIFEEVKVNHLIDITKQHLDFEAVSHQDISFTFPEEFAGFLLETLGAKMAPRSVQAAVAMVKADLINRAITQLDVDSQKIKISVKLAENANDGQILNIAVLDSSDRLFSEFHLDDSLCQITHFSSIEALESRIDNAGFDALLVNVHALSKDDSNVFAEKLSSIYSDLIVFSYSLDTHQAKVAVGHLPSLRTSGRHSDISDYSYPSNDKYSHYIVSDNAEGTLDSIDVKPEKSSLGQKNSQLRHITRQHFYLEGSSLTRGLEQVTNTILHRIMSERVLLRLKRRGEVVQYNSEVVRNGDTVEVVFRRIGYKQKIDRVDLGKDSLFNLEIPNMSFDDVIGLDAEKSQLRRAIKWVKSSDELKPFGIKPPKGYVFSGSPGNGKTMLAKALAGECKLPFFSMSAAQLVSSSYGETAKNIRKLFVTARKYSPSIVFIDEIDSIAPCRRSASAQNVGSGVLNINTLLTEIDGFDSGDDPVFVIAATNNVDLLDSALIRPGRIDEVINIRCPNETERGLYFDRFFCGKGMNLALEMRDDFAQMTGGLSGAELHQVIKESVYSAVSSKTAVNSLIIHEAVNRVVFGKQNMQVKTSNEDRTRTAYHEAGHLLAIHWLFPERRIKQVSIKPRGKALGFVVADQVGDNLSLTTEDVKKQLEVILAGRAAEKLFFGDENNVGGGASNDIDEATKLCVQAIYVSGLEPTIGSVNIQRLQAIGHSELSNKAESALLSWLENAQERIEKKLTTKRPMLDAVATQILKQETMSFREIQSLLLTLDDKLKIAV
ncbi:AAA family ATPase [Vibrio sp. 1F255]|uniref:AAA family ATPase n=1 Tax=Vibrio sp. 1F255 TaxID=3230009 RepID=UPI00352E08F4